MTRNFPVSFFVSVLSFLLMAAACRDNIKREESDVLGKENLLETICNTDDDCTVAKADCCGCRNGQQQIAIHKKDVKSWEDKLSSTCGDTMCIQMISNDPSCKKKPVCDDKHCQLR